MRTSPVGIALLKQFEGLELEAYQDITGVWTVGFGHTGDDVAPFMRISPAQAEDLLRRDVARRVKNLNSWVQSRRVALNQNQYDALISFIYNVGINGFTGSTAAKRLIKGDHAGAADALTWWNKATVNGQLIEVPGLTRRRAAERALFLKPTNTTKFHTRESNAQPTKECRRFFQ